MYVDLEGPSYMATTIEIYKCYLNQFSEESCFQIKHLC